MKNIFDKEKLEELRLDWECSELSLKKIAEKWGCNKSVIIRTLQRHGYFCSRSVDVKNRIRTEQLKESMRSKYGVDNASEIREWFPDKRKYIIDAEELSRKVFEGLSREELMKFFNISLSALKRNLKSNGLNIIRKEKGLLFNHGEFIKCYEESFGHIPTVAKKLGITDKVAYDRKYFLKLEIKPEWKDYRNSVSRTASKNTLMERYGVDNAMKVPEFKDKLLSKQVRRKSKVEIELSEFLNKYGVFKENRKILNGREIDLYSDKYKFGIELNGVYWHSDLILSRSKNISLAEARRFHWNKWKDCKDKGIKLLHIWDIEYEKKPEIVKNMILSKLGLSVQGKIFARKTKIVRPSIEEKSLFLKNNHIQGNDNCNFILGLEFDDRLVAVMTFRNSRSNREVELSRYATSERVVGGFGKLLKEALKIYPEISSWSDNRISDGNMYLKNGWVKVSETAPDYSIFYKGVLYHKSAFKKSNILKRYPEFYDSNLTEWEMECNMKAYRVWDCGKIKWSIKNS